MNDKEEIIVGDRTGCGCMIAVGLAALVLIVGLTMLTLAIVDCR